MKKRQALIAIGRARKTGVITSQYIRVPQAIAWATTGRGVILSFTARSPLPPND